MSLRLTIHQIMCGNFFLLDDIHDNSPPEKNPHCFFLSIPASRRGQRISKGRGDFEARRAENTRRGPKGRGRVAWGPGEAVSPSPWWENFEKLTLSGAFSDHFLPICALSQDLLKCKWDLSKCERIAISFTILGGGGPNRLFFLNLILRGSNLSVVLKCRVP